ncbi:hypothetical protein HCN44_009802 [Aphidius gifuensis]|uniref:Serine/threonine-protein kinase ATR n=1 Tax=Aphidius gifuensis TaxID=684658 RepID=A0A835CWJ4_APHGI|nr:serine/threonine-protein kinase ATR [Aphidius gifuensis]KAF7998404.1 hypothetical protein HCN44_009802 [Aphidius gifuensis]
MEVDQEESDSSPVEQIILEASELWKCIKKLGTLVSNESNSQYINPFLTSISNSSHLHKFLIPPVGVRGTTNPWCIQYLSFTKWLFGVCFKILCDQIADDISESNLQIQSLILRMLVVRHRVNFEAITDEYMIILDDILDFDDNKENKNYILIERFVVNQNAIDDMNLESYTIKIKSNFITNIQLSIMKIIINSGVIVWNTDKLWPRLLRIINNSEPEAKLMALKISLKILEFNLVDDKIVEILIDNTNAIISNLDNTWNEIDTINFWNILIDIFHHFIESPKAINLGYSILDTMLMRKENIKILENKICEKIQTALIKNPRTYSSDDAKNFIKYFDEFPNFYKIFIHYIILEIQTAHLVVIDLTETSQLWKLFLNLLSNKIKNNDSSSLVNLLKAPRVLSNWMIDNKIQGKLFNDPNNILEYLLNILKTTSNNNETSLIYSCLNEIIFIQDFDKTPIQNFLILPWLTKETSSHLQISEKLLEMAKSLSIDIQIECLKNMCKFGQGKKRISYLSICVMKKDIKLGIAAILNSIFLLQDSSISFLDLSTHILKPALTSKRKPLCEAVAKIIGPIVCFLSGQANFKKQIWDLSSLSSSNWTINCNVCDKKILPGLSSEFKIDEKLFMTYINLISSQFIEIRNNMSENLVRLSNHLEIFSKNNISKLWLPYLSDSNVKIRQNLSNSIVTLMENKIILCTRGQDRNIVFQNGLPTELDDFVENIIDEFSEILHDSLTNNKESNHLTLINTAKNLSKLQLDSIEERICNLFIVTIIHSRSSYNAIANAVIAYEEVARFSGLTLKEIYMRYKKNKIQLMMRLAAKNYLEVGHLLDTSLTKCLKCIGFTGGLQEFLEKDGDLALSFLVSLYHIVEEIEPIFSEIIYRLSTDSSEIFKKHFKHICVHVFLNESPEDGIMCLKKVSKIAKTSLRDLMTLSHIGIFRDLLIYFHDHEETVLTCLELISEFDQEVKGKKSFATKDDIAKYLNSQLHGVFVRFDANLVPLADQSTQKAALLSLGSLMNYMGPKYLSPLRFKILTTLRTSLSLTRPGLKKICCYAWECFVKNIPIDELGPLLPTIVVSMIPLLESCRNEVMKILEFIFIVNKKNLEQYISEVFFIKDLNVDQIIIDNVMSEIEKSTPTEFNEKLDKWLVRIKHETYEVRYKALCHLVIFLKEHRNELNIMILKETNIHPYVGELLDELLIGCCDKEEKIRMISGECLGELGAIEPSLRGRRITTRNDILFINSMINNINFVIELINSLVKAIQVEKNASNVSSFALAIQEILKFYQINLTDDDEIWKSLTPKCQQIIKPFKESRYTITAKICNKTGTVIYGSESGSTFEDWSFNWACSMMNTIEDVKISNLLNTFRPALKRDSKTTIFLIPYIFTYIVENGNDKDRLTLQNEIFSIIKVTDKKMDKELLSWKPLREFGEAHTTNRISDEARRVRCSQVVFSIFDYIERWLDESHNNRMNNKNYNKIKNFLNKFDYYILAVACYKLCDYHRSLMYLERHMTSNNKNLTDQNEMTLLANIYTQLEEPDGVSGILSTQNKLPSLQQRVIAHELNGQIQDAAICYERLAQKSLEPKYVQGLINCYLSLDQPFTAMKITRGILNQLPEYEPLIESHETFWHLADFQQLDETHETNVLKNLILENLKNKIKPDLYDIKKKLISQVGNASHEGVYQQNYSGIMKLHVLNEFEKATALMINNINNLPQIFKEWEERDQLIRTSKNVEFVLSMRRATLGFAVKLATLDEQKILLNKEIGKIWLKSAKIARKSGLYQQAYMYILSASDYCEIQELSIEQAQLYWEKGCQDEAFTTLKHFFSITTNLEKYNNSQSQKTPTKETKNYAKAKLLFAKYNDETLNVDPDKNINYYKNAASVIDDWEKSRLMYAQYIESYFDRMSEEEKIDGKNGLRYLLRAFSNYGKSLSIGCKYVHQSMPKMLSIWMDFAQKVQSLKQLSDKQNYILTEMAKYIDLYRQMVPKYVWLTALSQLVSRICHPSKIVSRKIKDILIDLIDEYPHYSIWMMIEIFNSSIQAKIKAGIEISSSSQFKKRKNKTEIENLINSFKLLAKCLVDLSYHEVRKDLTVVNIKDINNNNLQRLFERKNFGPIMMPTSKFFQVLLPTKKENRNNHVPFEHGMVSIVGVKPEVTVLSSLVRPKRITFIGSDGKNYRFMVKPKDDLRRDLRLMEFNTIVNTYLQKNPESRQRRLYIITYSVVPLSEKCGIIEWLSNLSGLRPTIMNLYKANSLGASPNDLRTHPNKFAPLEARRKAFVNVLLPKHPPILSQFFRKNFADPYSWYEARAAYIRTSAVMSMVGYIVGLGDRHGENLNINIVNGDCVHVDFNCLFNHGEKFEEPERVPFRLTQNMVEAMGPLGYEGPFRKSCETTLRVLRQEASTLISILTPFVYTENRNDALKSVKNIEERLKGVVKPSGTKSEIVVNLSVEGQTNHLILDAVNIDNLCQMFIGWGAYL